MSETGSCELYIGVWVGSVQTRSISHVSQAVRSRVGASGSIQRPRGVLEIRIHRFVWVLGLVPAGFGLFHIFLAFLLCLPPVLAIWTCVCFNFLSKIPKKLLYVPEAFLYCFVMLLHVKIDKKMNVHFFYIFVYFCAFFWWVSCIISVLIQYHVILMLGAQFCDAFAVDLWSSLLFLRIMTSISCLASNMNLFKCEICMKCVCVKLECMVCNFPKVLEIIPWKCAALVEIMGHEI